jgi:hypothetical protein
MYCPLASVVILANRPLGTSIPPCVDPRSTTIIVPELNLVARRLDDDLRSKSGRRACPQHVDTSGTKPDRSCSANERESQRLGRLRGGCRYGSSRRERGWRSLRFRSLSRLARRSRSRAAGAVLGCGGRDDRRCRLRTHRRGWASRRRASWSRRRSCPRPRSRLGVRRRCRSNDGLTWRRGLGLDPSGRGRRRTERWIGLRACGSTDSLTAWLPAIEGCAAGICACLDDIGTHDRSRHEVGAGANRACSGGRMDHSMVDKAHALPGDRHSGGGGTDPQQHEHRDLHRAHHGGPQPRPNQQKLKSLPVPDNSHAECGQHCGA